MCIRSGMGEGKEGRVSAAARQKGQKGNDQGIGKGKGEEEEEGGRERAE